MKFSLLTLALALATTASAGPAASNAAILNSLATALPACQSTHGDGDLRLDTSCVGDLCAHHTPSQLHQRATTSACTQRGSQARVACTFDEVRTQRSVYDAPGSSVGSIFPTSAYRGKTFDGLGLGVSVACFLEALPAPSSVQLNMADDGSYTVRSLRFDSPRVSITDHDGDGRVDQMQLSSRKNKIRATNNARPVSVPR